MLYLYVQAPFAACRTFTAGWYRPTATFLTPSAAYGLVLNVAGSRAGCARRTTATTARSRPACTRGRAAPVRLAVGAPAVRRTDPYPHVQTVYQQLHNYPVGASGTGAGRDRPRATSTTSRRFAVSSCPTCER